MFTFIFLSVYNTSSGTNGGPVAAGKQLFTPGMSLAVINLTTPGMAWKKRKITIKKSTEKYVIHVNRLIVNIENI